MKVANGSVDDDQISGTLGYRKNGRQNRQCDSRGKLQGQGKMRQRERRRNGQRAVDKGLDDLQKRERARRETRDTPDTSCTD